MPKMHDKTTDKPKAPRSEAQKAAARRNGAKSRGPVSDAGKAASSRNALRHGLTAFQLALSCEDQESFNLVLADYMDEYRPLGPTETNLVERIAFAQWQMYRAWTAETAILNVEIETNRAKLDQKFTHFQEPVRVADAIESSLARTGSLAHLNRCLARINREYFQSLKMLRAIRKEVAETNPANDEVDSNPQNSGAQHPERITAETNPTDAALTQSVVDDFETNSRDSGAQNPGRLTAETNPAAASPALIEPQAPLRPESMPVSSVGDHDNGRNSPSEINPEWNRRTA